MDEDEKQFAIWSEGYIATGESSGASFHGTFTAVTFRDAVEKWRDTLKDQHSKNCVDVEALTFWGCRLFDNLDDARKRFG